MEERNKKLNDEMDEAKAVLGPRLTQWAEDNGKKRNVRTLLTTMHEVLWEGARWKPLSLADVIDPKKVESAPYSHRYDSNMWCLTCSRNTQVKLAYRKAMLVVHPDRNTNSSGTDIFVAKRIFEAINEAYNVFLEHEQP